LQLKKEFTTYKIKNIIPLKSTYSIRLYEIFKKYEKIGEKKYTVKELKKILQIENEYKLYGHLNDRILRVAEKELKQKCDIYFEMIEVKIGKRVDSIRFLIHKNIDIDKATE
jgi:plasmid replication initiation protein